MRRQRASMMAAITTCAVLLGGPATMRAEDESGRPVLDQAVKTREADEEAAAESREAAANRVKANADAAQVHAQTEEVKEATKEQAAAESAHAELAPAPLDGSALIDELARSLGVSRAQATGGAGAIFSVAHRKLDAEDFDNVAAAAPGIQIFLAAAPGGSSQSDDQFGGVASLAGPFTKLGMSPELAGKFLPVVLQYVQQNGGDAPMDLLAHAFK